MFGFGFEIGLFFINKVNVENKDKDSIFDFVIFFNCQKLISFFVEQSSRCNSDTFLV